MEIWVEIRHCVGCNHFQDVYGVENSETIMFICQNCKAITYLARTINDVMIDTT